MKRDVVLGFGGEMCMKRVWIRVEKGHCLLSAKVDLMSCRGCHNPGEGKCIDQRDEILEVFAFVALCLFRLRANSGLRGRSILFSKCCIGEHTKSADTDSCSIVKISRIRMPLKLAKYCGKCLPLCSSI